MALAKFGQQRRQMPYGRHGTSNPQPPFHLLLVLSRHLLYIAQRPVYLQRFLQDLLTYLGQGQLARGTLYQPRAQVLLQPGQLARQHRFAASHLYRRLADAAGAHNAGKSGQVLRV